MKNVPQKTLERNYLAEDFDCIVGVDEVGMGCLAGPVVVCALLIEPAFYAQRHPELAGVKDSKLLSPAQRDRLAGSLRGQSYITHTLVTVSPRDVDTYNVLQAARRGMTKAIARLMRSSGRTRPVVLVDGNREVPDIPWLQKTIIGGDRRIFSIACASILAKVHRDALMVRASKKYPGYGFEIHKGYGTRMHYAALAARGPTLFHRQTFCLTATTKNSTV